jgi:hypothetical protein
MRPFRLMRRFSYANAPGSRSPPGSCPKEGLAQRIQQLEKKVDEQEGRLDLLCFVGSGVVFASSLFLVIRKGSTI